MLEERHLYRDSELDMEYCTFINLPQKFPNHFHDYYVIGLIVKGQRELTCNQQFYQLEPGDLFILNPYDPHTCVQLGDIPLDYHCLHISEKRMKELTGSDTRFISNVITSLTAQAYLRQLFAAILANDSKQNKEDLFYLVIDALSTKIKQQNESLSLTYESAVTAAINYIDQHLEEKLSLDTLAHHTGQNKFTLIRHFLKTTGVTPYQYLETTRIIKAKELLKKQEKLAHISYQLGYTDQSHFSNAFKKITGITPKTYQKIYHQHTH